MRRLDRLATLVVICCGGLLPRGAEAQSATVSAELAFKSAYLFAGIPFAAEEVTQARVSVGTGAFTLNGFSSFDHAASEVTEADIYGDYYMQLAPTVGAFVGAAYYNFKFATGWEGTPEIYAGVVLAAPLNPTLFAAHDFDLGDGTHVLLSLSHEVPLGGGGATLGFAGNLDYNDGYYVDVSGFSYYDVGASIGIPVGPVTLRLMVVIQRAIEDGFVDEEVFGVSASFTF